MKFISRSKLQCDNPFAFLIRSSGGEELEAARHPPSLKQCK